MSKEIDIEIGQLKKVLDSVVDEVIPVRRGMDQLVHHVGGDSTNRLVIGTRGRGKSLFSEEAKLE